jgi:hypothetical protein
MLAGLISGALSLAGSGVKGFFGVKERQLDTVQSGISALSDANSSAAQKERAIADIISSEMQSGYWLAAVWRPMIMVVFAGLLVAYFFGYTTPNLMMPMPANSVIGEIFNLLTIGLTGYIPARTVEKIATQINIGRVLSKLIEKNVN